MSPGAFDRPGSNPPNAGSARGIKNVAKTNGNLIFTFTDNTTQDLGKVDGTPGKVVQSNAVNANGHLIVTYTDNTTADLGLVRPPASTWRTGTGAPSNALGADGDQYLNTATGDVYSRANGTYSLSGNIKGADGADGTGTSGSSLYTTIPGSDFNVLVNGVTALPALPNSTAQVILTVTGGDIFASTSGAPTSASTRYGDTAQLEISPLADAQAFQCIVASGTPRLVGYAESVAGAALTLKTLAGSDFNIPVVGVTQLGAQPAAAVAVYFTVTGGDMYATTTGTTPTSSSPLYVNGTELEISPLADVQAFRCIAANGTSPRLVGYAEGVS